MLLTEEEAKERWCPFAREVTGDDNGVQMAMTSYNRPFGPEPEKREVCNCIASQCMAWQWTTTAKMGLSRDGYCGLTGNPNLASDIASQQVAAKDREAQ